LSPPEVRQVADQCGRTIGGDGAGVTVLAFVVPTGSSQQRDPSERDQDPGRPLGPPRQDGSGAT
jgi:hypothetical protein